MDRGTSLWKHPERRTVKAASCSSGLASWRRSTSGSRRWSTARMAAWCLSRVRREGARRPCCGGFAKSTMTGPGFCGVPATRCSRRVRSARCSTSPSSPAASSRRSWPRGAKPHEVVAALIERARGRATVLVLEDLHWADEATLDVLRLLARRITTFPRWCSPATATTSSTAAHPLRIVLGELARSEAISRLRLAPLSPAAVAELAEPHGLDADELYRTTAGNPFFVTEVLAAGGQTDPAHRPRRGARPDGAPQSGGQDAARGGRDRAAAGRALAPGGARG